MPISHHGNKKKKNGYILLDAIIAIIIAGVSFTATLSAITNILSTAHNVREKLYKIISSNNSYAENREIFFTQE